MPIEINPTLSLSLSLSFSPNSLSLHNNKNPFLPELLSQTVLPFALPPKAHYALQAFSSFSLSNLLPTHMAIPKGKSNKNRAADKLNVTSSIHSFHIKLSKVKVRSTSQNISPNMPVIFSNHPPSILPPSFLPSTCTTKLRFHHHRYYCLGTLQTPYRHTEQ